MGRVLQLSFSIALLIMSTLPAAPGAAAVPGFDAGYAAESAFLTTGPGMSGQFQVLFKNTGTTTWQRGTDRQVVLAICLPNKTTCNVESPYADWNDGSWYSTRAYATHTQAVVAPGDLATFTWSFKTPLNVTAGIYRFHGDLALAAAPAVQIHPEGYYHEASCACDRFP
jgi:hypothetical protein